MYISGPVPIILDPTRLFRVAEVVASTLPVKFSARVG
nr:MAG TPA: hypothetical protein [Bacteriophage sp.]